MPASAGISGHAASMRLSFSTAPTTRDGKILSRRAPSRGSVTTTHRRARSFPPGTAAHIFSDARWPGPACTHVAGRPSATWAAILGLVGSQVVSSPPPTPRSQRYASTSLRSPEKTSTRTTRPLSSIEWSSASVATSLTSGPRLAT